MTPPSLFVGTATSNGIVAAAHASSLVVTVQRLAAGSIPTTYRSADGPVLAIVRDLLAAEFLRSPATHMLLLDGDLRFTSDLAERLLALNEPLAGAAYALAGPDLREVARLTPTHGLDEAIALASPWNVRPLEGGIEVAGGRARIAALGPGCLLVRRDCLQALSGSLRRYAPTPGGPRVTAFFRSLPCDRQDRILQDRLSILWREAGGDVWIDVEADVARLSTFRFGAPFSEYLRAISPSRSSALPNLKAAPLKAARS